MAAVNLFSEHWRAWLENAALRNRGTGRRVLAFGRNAQSVKPCWGLGFIRGL